MIATPRCARRFSCQLAGALQCVELTDESSSSFLRIADAAVLTLQDSIYTRLNLQWGIPLLVDLLPKMRSATTNANRKLQPRNPASDTADAGCVQSLCIRRE
jgi:hypothetical protein